MTSTMGVRAILQRGTLSASLDHNLRHLHVRIINALDLPEDTP